MEHGAGGKGKALGVNLVNLCNTMPQAPCLIDRSNLNEDAP